MIDRAPFAHYTARETRDAHKGGIGTLGWNCNGRKLATGSTDEVVRTWTIDMFSPGRDRRDSELQIGREPNSICWSPQSPDQLATSAADNLIRVWDVRASKASVTVKLKKSAFLFLAWNPADPSILAAVQQENDTYFIDLKKQKVLKVLPCKLLVNQVKFSKNGKLFFRTVSSGGIEVFSFPELVKLHCIMAHLAAVHSLDIDANERLLASGGTDASISIFELQTLSCIQSFSDINHPARSVSFSPDGSFLAYFAEGEPDVFIENVWSGERAAHLATQQAPQDLAWNPKHLVLAYTGSRMDGARSASMRYGHFCIYAPKKE